MLEGNTRSIYPILQAGALASYRNLCDAAEIQKCSHEIRILLTIGFMSDHVPKTDKRRRLWRRPWTVAEKLAIVQESYAPGATVASVARKHAMHTAQLFLWRKMAAENALDSGRKPAVFTARPADLHIGARVRERRRALDMSLSDLAQRVGRSPQNLDRYERGMLRLQSSMLMKIAQCLNVPMEWFVEGLDEGAAISPPSDSADVQAFLKSDAGVTLGRAFLRIRSDALREHLLRYMETLGPGNDL